MAEVRRVTVRISRASHPLLLFGICYTLMVHERSSNPTLRIKLKSYDIKMLESSVAKIVWLLVKSWATTVWPIPLPQKIKRFTVLRSTFKFKKAREQFERKTYTRLIDVVENWPKTIEYLQNLPVPVGVMVFVKVF